MKKETLNYIVIVILYIGITSLINMLEYTWAKGNVMHYVTSQYLSLFFLSLIILKAHKKLVLLFGSNVIKGLITLVSVGVVIVTIILKITETYNVEAKLQSKLNDSIYYVDNVYLLWSISLCVLLIATSLKKNKLAETSSAASVSNAQTTPVAETPSNAQSTPAA